ncbi:MAG: nucleotidyltransferase family protein [Hymenobacteraceae bacterium]|nr:nucleotidyltransferase family protein [Hymenobacteraceae bacterium]
MSTAIPFEHITRALRAYFAGKPIRRVAVFGSYAREQARPDSDLDVLVTPEHPVGLLALAGYQCDLEDLLGIKVDLGTEAGVSKWVRPLIARDLRVVYEK